MAMDQTNGDGSGYVGRSELGFSDATADAVRRAEESGDLRPEEEGTITLVVDRMEIDVHGPIGEYRTVLKRVS